jgi:hypothetical protein
MGQGVAAQPLLSVNGKSWQELAETGAELAFAGAALACFWLELARIG